MAVTSIRPTPRPGDYSSLAQAEARWLKRAIRPLGRRLSFLDVLDPTGLYIGQIFADRQSSKVYKLVKADATIVTVTDPDVWAYTSTGTVSNDLSATIGATTGAVAGFTVTTTPAANEYFWLQVGGLVEGMADGNATTAGNLLVIGSDNTLAVRNNDTYPRNVFAMTDSAASTCNVWIKSGETMI